MRLNDLTGRTFGRLRVTKRDGSDKFNQATWECVCDCGKSTVVCGHSLTRGSTQSCGCLVGYVARTRPSALYDGLTLAEHAERSGIPQSTLDKRVRKYGYPFPAHLSDELRVFEQDRENNKRTCSRRLGRAADHHLPNASTSARPRPRNPPCPSTGRNRTGRRDPTRRREMLYGQPPPPGMQPVKPDRRVITLKRDGVAVEAMVAIAKRDGIAAAVRAIVARTREDVTVFDGLLRVTIRKSDSFIAPSTGRRYNQPHARPVRANN